MAFIKNLRILLNNPSITTFTWSADGCTVVIRASDKAKISTDLLTVFGHGKFSSLQRQLNAYAFSKKKSLLSAAEFQFTNPSFTKYSNTDNVLKNSISLSAKVASKPSSKPASKSASKPASKPTSKPASKPPSKPASKPASKTASKKNNKKPVKAKTKAPVKAKRTPLSLRNKSTSREHHPPKQSAEHQ